jgi:type I restriction enzyme S subunit
MTAVARVAALAEQIRGVSYGKEDASSNPRPGYLPVLRAGNISEDGLVFDALVFVPAERISAKQKIRENDVVIAASSGSIDVVGKAARALTDYEGGFGAFCKVLRPGPMVDPAYFAHFFRTPVYRRRVSALAAGVNINNLRNEHLDEMVVPLPPLPEQRRIAEILDKADALRAKRRAVLAQLDTLAQSIFLDMFGDHTNVLKRWPIKKLGELLDFLTSGSRGWAEYYSDSGALFLRIQNVRNDELLLDDIAYVNAPDTAEAKRTKVQSGDVLLSITADLGRSAVVPEGIGTAFINQHLSILRTTALVPRFLSAYFSSPAGQRQVLGRNRQAVKAGLNFDDIRSFLVPLPPIDLQREFARRVGVVEKLKAVQRASLAKLDALFASLQHRSFRGEL